MSEKTFRQASRDEWINSASGNPSDTQIATGALQRIADATEAMAKNWNELMRQRDNFERWYRNEQKSTARLTRSNAALRGVIKRLRTAQVHHTEKP